MAAMPWTWRWRRRLWTTWHLLRYRLNRPQHIAVPPPNSERIDVVPIGQIHRRIPLREVRAFERLPKDEARLGMRIVVGLGLLLERVISSMQPGLDEIDDDADRALADAAIDRYASSFRAPVRPAAFASPGRPDLGRLAVESPYAVFLERGSDGLLVWDFRRLADFEHHEGLCSLGLRVVFDDSDGLAATRIESTELGLVEPHDPDWDRATTLAVCAATTQAALGRHFHDVHLVSGDHWDIASRNRLPSDHPLYRLLWPHNFNGCYTNYAVTRVQLLPGGDFVNMFSFTHDGLMSYFDEMYRSYDITVIDPVADWYRRGLGDERFATPTQSNLVELFSLFHSHALRSLEASYPSDDHLRSDAAVCDWLTELAGLVPNGLGGLDDEPTRAGLARLVAAYINEGSAVHDMVGTTLWDYQLWTDCNPTRVHRDGRRVTLDVLQRVINNNFALQIRRAPLLADYGVVALDERVAASFTTLFEECRSLQARYDEVPAGPWRMEPRNLEINMNG